MPTWDKRQCQRNSKCVDSGNSCNDEGVCICVYAENEYAVGAGASAMCIPREDMNFIMPALKAFVYFLVATALLFALFCLGWIYYYRTNMLVKVAQPMCLCLIVVGCVISIFSIIPMGYDTEYRDNSDDIRLADAACMAVPWLWGLGFTISFSSLFAKVWRVKQLFKSAAGFRRQKVGMKSVLTIMAGMIFVEATILTTFQIVSPQIWERDVINDIDGFAIESEGGCYSESGWWFWLALVLFNVLSLFYALVLCFQTKDIPSEFAESTHIFLSVMFMFQVLVLAVPVSAMVKDDPDVFYFIRAAAVWLQNVTVLIIIFGPKMLRIFKGEDTGAAIRKTIASGVSKHSVQSFSEHNTATQQHWKTSNLRTSNSNKSLSDWKPGSSTDDLDKTGSSNKGWGADYNRDSSGAFSVTDMNKTKEDVSPLGLPIADTLDNNNKASSGAISMETEDPTLRKNNMDCTPKGQEGSCKAVLLNMVGDIVVVES